jgi:hypothetical protein
MNRAQFKLMWPKKMILAWELRTKEKLGLKMGYTIDVIAAKPENEHR